MLEIGSIPPPSLDGVASGLVSGPPKLGPERSPIANALLPSSPEVDWEPGPGGENVYRALQTAVFQRRGADTPAGAIVRVACKRGDREARREMGAGRARGGGGPPSLSPSSIRSDS